MTTVDALYPLNAPFNEAIVRVSPLHSVFYEESGNPDGVPILYIHGGPGGGTSPRDRRYFDPAFYRIILVDQRGCGKSTPFAELRENTTWDLVSDFELIREKLGIKKWAIFGGSWGSTLALAYSIKHPERVSALVLRGIFLLRKSEIDWFYQAGASEIFPDFWENYRDSIPASERGDFVAAYHKRLTSPDADVRVSAAQAWTRWELLTSRLHPNLESVSAQSTDQFAEAFARIECHYFTNRGFFETDGWLLTQIDRIRKIPAMIIQGRYDVVCPIRSAWDLHRAWPEAKLQVIGDAGHSAQEPGITAALVAATDGFKKTFSQSE